ncbi:MAG: helix-turn-helix transcriptional regulator [Alphaproteobacteria bacterium]|nr:helix-turn-helix transcriptional regulator [Alphaproteobacteria bacterium]
MQKKESKNGTIRGRQSDGSPNPIDLHVGRQLKKARQLCGLSQTKLAERLNLTFQVIQKYENGQVRIGASRLWELARLLNVNVDYFFNGFIPSDTLNRSESLDKTGLILTKQDIEFIKNYKSITDQKIINSLSCLVKKLSA